MDIQLQLKEGNDFAFIQEVVKDVDLSFEIEYVRWNHDTEDNDHVKTEVVPVKDFSSYWSSLISAGWKIVDG